MKELTKIFHLSDIHIRLFDRHTEYREVFEKTYELIKKHKDDHSIAIVAGDIVHTKIELSPEAVNLTFDFFKNLSDIIPTYVIAGNHDCNLKNPDRMDALSPIIENIHSDDLHYWKENGVYEVGDWKFSVMSIFSPEKDYIKSEDIDGNKIALYHGKVQGSMNDFGFEFKKGDISIDVFDGFDFTLLGDIHRMQYLDKAKTVAYPGSLIQQNYGESLDHGFLIWDLEKGTSEFIKVPNNYGFYTVNISDPKNIPTLTGLPEYAKVRVKHDGDFDYAQKKEISSAIRQLHGDREIIYQKEKVDKEVIEEQKNIIIGDVKDTNYQFELIQNFLEDRESISDDVYDEIKVINETCNSQIKSTDLSRNIVWSPKQFEFSQMFAYGENNIVDFSKMNGIVGIFAPNASGKSSILDSFLYTIWDKCARTGLAGSVMNTKSDTFSANLTVDINGTDYVIDKNATKTGAKTSVDIDFTKQSAKPENLNGEQRRDTNANIQKYFGTFDNIALTSLSIQNDNHSVIDMTQANRKEHFAQFMGLDIFEKLHDIAKKKVKESKTILKEYKGEDFSSKMITEESNLKVYSDEYDKQSLAKSHLDVDIDTINEQIIEKNKELKTINMPVQDLTQLEKNKDILSNDVEVASSDAFEKETQLADIESEINKITSELDQYDIDTITEKVDERKQYESKKTSINTDLQRMKITVETKIDKLSKIEKFEYNPDCSRCKTNATVYSEETVKTNDELLVDKETVEKLIDELSRINEKLTELDEYVNQLSIYEDKENLLNTRKIEKSKIQNDKDNLTNKITSAENKLKEVERDINNYLQAREDIENNKEIMSELSNLETEKSKLENERKSVDTIVKDYHAKIEVSKTLIKEYNDKINKITKLEKETKAYDYYIKAVHRDGVPYQLLKNTLPHVEAEINNILEQMVEFRIVLGMQGKDFNIMVSYGDDETWPVELGSGFEKFISSVAIRSAFLEISSLPRPTFLAIDEGFGVLDSENLTALNQLFEYLKTKYEFVLVISHLEALRDMVDDFIEITKESGFSKVVYN